MSTTLLPAVFVIVGLSFFYFLIYPVLLSPLAKIPNAHFLSPFTTLWIQWRRYVQQEIQAVDAAYRKKGPIVRLGPNEIAVNLMPGAIKTIHGAPGYDKTEWYDFYANFDTRNAFSTYSFEDHVVIRRRVSRIYSKSFIQTSPHVQKILSAVLLDRYLPALSGDAQQTRTLNALDLNFSYGLDVITAFVFGLQHGTNFIENIDERRAWFSVYLESHPPNHMFWLLELPNLTKWLARCGLPILPQSYYDARKGLADWAMKSLTAAEEGIPSQGFEELPTGDSPLLLGQIREEMIAEEKAKITSEKVSKEDPTFLRSESRLQLASECLDHIRITYTYTLYQLSLHPEIQHKLRQELLTAVSKPEHSVAYDVSASPLGTLPQPSTLESLPYLHAVIKESLRLRNTFPTSNPRITPSKNGNRGNTEIGPYKKIPAGVRVVCFAYSVQRNEEIYKEATVWRPERWIAGESRESKEELKKMEQWFWAFGSGSRSCIGKHLAMEMLRQGLAAIYTNYSTHVADDSGFGQNGNFVTGGISDSLMLRFEALEKKDGKR
ncbi:MAG: hypothetical protein Q9165_001113 [Trypethelium subeluteriae]